jgi:hypothetical protein
MTIGIAAHGPGAGLAVFAALRGVERVGRGAIGGFASFVCLTETGELVRAETQRGGTTTLFTDGEATGVPPPPAVAAAPLAAVMSSGPDRPTPLAQFTPGEAGVGLVTGHRLPNRPGVDGVAVNLAVLARMRAGASAREAIDAELERNPAADAGLIALDVRGGLCCGNTALVARRADLGIALERDGETGAAVAVLHNAIHPAAPLAQLAAQLALDSMNPCDRADWHVEVRAGTSVVLADRNAVVLDENGSVARVEVDRPALVAAYAEGAVIGPAALVVRGDRVLGRTTSEPYGVVADGRIRALSGRDVAVLGVRTSASRPAGSSDGG